MIKTESIEELKNIFKEFSKENKKFDEDIIQLVVEKKEECKNLFEKKEVIEVIQDIEVIDEDEEVER
jgi:hypothetical protein